MWHSRHLCPVPEPCPQPEEPGPHWLPLSCPICLPRQCACFPEAGSEGRHLGPGSQAPSTLRRASRGLTADPMGQGEWGYRALARSLPLLSSGWVSGHGGDRASTSAQTPQADSQGPEPPRCPLLFRSLSYLSQRTAGCARHHSAACPVLSWSYQQPKPPPQASLLHARQAPSASLHSGDQWPGTHMLAPGVCSWPPSVPACLGTRTKGADFRPCPPPLPAPGMSRPAGLGTAGRGRADPHGWVGAVGSVNLGSPLLLRTVRQGPSGPPGAMGTGDLGPGPWGVTMGTEAHGTQCPAPA